ncbi:hypothetical protein BJ165DRAFT_1529235 [Panaeolus papilionaceus]|nr:hypothetical protein BJ165DRAFT_1529235 [Panaeolus papilionaceus]
MSGKLVLITGVSGFVAGHTAEQLLEKGYRVRGTARGSKYDQLITTVDRPGLEFIRVDDVATADFTEVLKGVDAVLHIACPLPGRKELDETFSSAIDGTLNLVKQAQKAGIKNVVVTSSFGTLLHPSHGPAFSGGILTEKNWGEGSRQDVIDNNGDVFYVYMTAKIMAEKALWQFVAENPEMDVKTILPGYIMGPYPRLFSLPTSASSLGTNEFIWNMIHGGDVPIAPNWIVDVRDVAKGHILALETENLPPANPDKRRFIINSATYSWKEAAAHLKKARPEAAKGIIDLETAPNPPGPLTELDNTQAKEVLKFGEFITPQKTFEDAVDDFLELKKAWAEQK